MPGCATGKTIREADAEVAAGRTTRLSKQEALAEIER
jgi:hypothetical protein